MCSTWSCPRVSYPKAPRRVSSVCWSMQKKYYAVLTLSCASQRTAATEGRCCVCSTSLASRSSLRAVLSFGIRRPTCFTWFTLLNLMMKMTKTMKMTRMRGTKRSKMRKRPRAVKMMEWILRFEEEGRKVSKETSPIFLGKS